MVESVSPSKVASVVSVVVVSPSTSDTSALLVSPSMFTLSVVVSVVSPSTVPSFAAESVFSSGVSNKFSPLPELVVFVPPIVISVVTVVYNNLLPIMALNISLHLLSYKSASSCLRNFLLYKLITTFLAITIATTNTTT